MSADSSLDWARAQDAADPLAALRGEFHFPDGPDGPATYLCGNSLGLQPRQATTEVARILGEWQRLGVLGHHHEDSSWMRYEYRLAASLARLAGALESEVIAMHSLTLNLHLLMASFYRPTRGRAVVLIERGAFPSDRYAVVSQLRWHGLDPAHALVELAPRPGEDCLRTADIEESIRGIGDRLALVLLPGIHYLTGQVLDMATITRAARAAGAHVGFDLAHAIGNVPLALHEWGPDFAVWCSYKYLNAGPGATAGAFIHERHHAPGTLRLAGWWGNELDSRFEFADSFRPARGAAGWQVSNHPVIAMAPLKASLEQFDAVGLPALVARSRRLTGYLESLLDAHLADRFEIITPRDPLARGAQLSLRLRGGSATGRKTFDALIARGVIGDWREPDVIRLAPAPMYNSFEDCWRAVDVLRRL
jgi:kynureninase